MAGTATKMFARRLAAVMVVVGLVLIGLFASPHLVTAQAVGQPPNDAALVAALQRGGYVIVFRHGITDKTQNDRQPLDLSNCQAQRNLDAAGRAQALHIGDAFLALALPVGEVISSPFCRALDTAQLAFGFAATREELLEIVTPLDANGNPRQPTPAAIADQRTAVLRSLLSTPAAAGTNTMVVSHGSNIEAATGLKFEEGDAAVLLPQLPNGAAGFSLVARLSAADWTTLALTQGTAAGKK